MMHRNVKLFALLLLLLTGCAGPETAAAGAQSKSVAGDRPHAMAGVPSEDCLLCNGLGGTRYSYCWGQDNLALLSLNTGEGLAARDQPLRAGRADRGVCRASEHAHVHER